jgi:hypothetical protein
MILIWHLMTQRANFYMFGYLLEQIVIFFFISLFIESTNKLKFQIAGDEQVLARFSSADGTPVGN